MTEKGSTISQLNRYFNFGGHRVYCFLEPKRTSKFNSSKTTLIAISFPLIDASRLFPIERAKCQPGIQGTKDLLPNERQIFLLSLSLVRNTCRTGELHIQPIISLLNTTQSILQTIEESDLSKCTGQYAVMRICDNEKELLLLLTRFHASYNSRWIKQSLLPTVLTNITTLLSL